METAVAWFEIQSFLVLCCILETVEGTYKVNFLAELFRILRHAEPRGLFLVSSRKSYLV